MKSILTYLIFLVSCSSAYAQYENESSEEYPYGKPHPEAPEAIKDYALMIGQSQCKSTSRNQDGTWAGPIDMLWTFKYIMNGKAVQDETLKSDGSHSGSIRQLDTDGETWNVHYYSSKGVPKTLPAWEGKNKDGKVRLYREQKAPNGTDGFFRLTFYDISKSSYKWIGEWVDTTETTIFPTWKIDCQKTEQ